MNNSIDLSRVNREDFNVSPRGEFVLITPKKHKHIWEEHELHLRSLLVRPSGEIVSAGFPKFVNYGENPSHDAAFRKELEEDCVMFHEKLDGCFPAGTTLNLWGGGTIRIGEVVQKQLTPTLIGRDAEGNLVPTKVLNWHNNGAKDRWVGITVGCNTSIGSKGMGGHANTIVVTPNHEVWTERGFLPAGAVRVGDVMGHAVRAPCANALHSIRAGLLGDGCLGITRKTGAVRYEGGHKMAHLEYVEAKRRWLGECATKSRERVSGYGTRMAVIQSAALPPLKELRDEWYPNGKRVIPQDLSWVDDFAVAVWYMDNGSLAHSELQQDRAVFSMSAFMEDDTRRMAALLESTYGVDATVYYSKGWNIRINYAGGSIDTFWQAIAPHILPCMRYKLPEQLRDSAYTPYPEGRLLYKQVPAIVTEVTEYDTSDPTSLPTAIRRRRTGFDITTETGNYFARGVLVHNSLIIVSRIDGKAHLRTRGNHDLGDFDAPVRKLIADKYHTLLSAIETRGEYEGMSVLLEYVGPENRIVLNYEEPRLVLLATVEFDWGIDDGFPLQVNTYPDRLRWVSEHLGVPVARRYDHLPADFNALMAEVKGWQDEEGVVASFHPDGAAPLRMIKVKATQYVRLHSIKFKLEGKVGKLCFLLGITSKEEAKDKLSQMGVDYEAREFVWPEVESYLSAYKRLKEEFEYFLRICSVSASISKDSAENDRLARADYVSKLKVWLDTSSIYDGSWFSVAMSLYDGKVEDAWIDIVSRKILDQSPLVTRQWMTNPNTELAAMLEVPGSDD